ncbi:methyl-accepting chemotaxis protein [Roseateles koreensis]|uniref:Methyl-accepting chemotaxis protein n=1 Tax=Roseateles koreensis TaxID=2987526 RepID=A0ABT5KSP4_9BURK|nr:methyl-accepting chemotaxis protein [Roseateles koreensis]MDC8785957.1 methyl-accepting chemotaxis protein [Roseateles koreensis]
MIKTPWSDQSSIEADRLVVALLGMQCVYALVLGWTTAHLSTALMAVAILVVIAIGLLWKRLPGPWNALILTAMLGVSGNLEVYLDPGNFVAHEGMFVSLCVLLLYENWRPVVFAGLLFIGSRLAFQGWWDGGGMALTSQKVLMSNALSDVVMVSFLTALMAAYCVRQAKRTQDSFEMEFLVRAMGKDGPVRLHMDAIRVQSNGATRLKDVQIRMANTLKQVREVIFSVHSAAQEMSGSSAELKSRTDTTHQGLADSAMSLEQINVIVQESARASREAREYANSASVLANRGGDVVSQMVSAMQEIDGSSRRITDIIGVIDSIAFQTNILALNAAVEAARAGEQGRGFAVVASEVRSLAKRSSEAAREIKGLIGASVASVERGTRLADDAGKAMGELVASVKQVGQVFENLTADSSEHAQGIDVITSSVRELGLVTQQNVHVAERSGEMAYELQIQAAKLAEVLSAFRLGDDDAVERIRDEAQQAVARAQEQRSMNLTGPTVATAVGAGAASVDFF